MTGPHEDRMEVDKNRSTIIKERTMKVSRSGHDLPPMVDLVTVMEVVLLLVVLMQVTWPTIKKGQ